MRYLYALYVLVIWNNGILDVWTTVLSVGSRRSSLSEFQAVGQATANARRDAHTSWDCVEAERDNNAWQNENVVDWYFGDWNAVVHQVPWSLVMKVVMHHRHELKLHSFRHVEPIKVDMHKLLQTAIELLVSLITRRAAAFKRLCNLSVVAFG